MHYALVNNERTEPKTGLNGKCPFCAGDVIAKCGNQRVHHWAHVSIETCDSWLEQETEWHRTWKNNYPPDWQEYILKDQQTGEKHIADIRTNHGLVLEFQHSHIDPEERISREKYYQNMIWVVDGTRLIRDYPRFIEGKDNIKSTSLKGFFLVSFIDEIFPKDWIESSVPVILDFLGTISTTNPQDVMRNPLWCLLPGRAEGYALIVGISRKDFVDRTLNHPQLFQDPAHKFIEAFAEYIQQQKRMVDKGYNTRRIMRGKRHFRF